MATVNAFRSALTINQVHYDNIFWEHKVHCKYMYTMKIQFAMHGDKKRDWRRST